MNNNLIDLSDNVEPASEILIELNHIQYKNIRELITQVDKDITQCFNEPQHIALNMTKINNTRSEISKGIKLLNSMNFAKPTNEIVELNKELSILLLKIRLLKGTYHDYELAITNLKRLDSNTHTLVYLNFVFGSLILIVTLFVLILIYVMSG